MEVIWDSLDAADATGGLNTQHWQSSDLVIDSRKVQPGNLFIALKGTTTDGHNYIAEAANNGAAAAIVEKHLDGPDIPLLVVKNSYQALLALAAIRRKQIANAKVIGVTGSVGKTSTKAMLHHALTRHGKTYSNRGNYNNHVGTPVSLASTPPNADFAIYEMGMNSAGEIANLTKMVQPNIAIITSIEPAHMEFFVGIEAIANAKAEIMQGITKNGFVILNQDSNYYQYLVDIAKNLSIDNIISFGASDHANCRLLYYLEEAGHSIINADIMGTKITYKLRSLGLHQAKNSIAVLAAANLAGCDIATTALTLADFSALKGRGERKIIRKNGKEFVLIDDSYNASPASMQASLTMFSAYNDGKARRRLAIIADMRELGKNSIALHQDLLAYMDNIDKVITLGENMQKLYEILPADKQSKSFSSLSTLLEEIDPLIEDNDVVLVKGSLGTGIWQLVEQLEK